MDRGYWKHWRKTKDSGLFRFPKQYTLWGFLLNEASHNSHTYPDGNRVEPGQVITSLSVLSAECGQGVQSIRTNLKHLETSGRITIEPTSRYTKVTILNWQVYQSTEATLTREPTREPTRQPTRNQHASNTRLTTTKNSNSNSKRKEYPDEAMRLAALLRELVLANDQKAPVPVNGGLSKWADAIDKINRLDGREWAEVESVIRWVQQDGFWWKNVMSGTKLRKQFTRLLAEAGEGKIKQDMARAKKADREQERRAVEARLTRPPQNTEGGMAAIGNILVTLKGDHESR